MYQFEVSQSRHPDLDGSFLSCVSAPSWQLPAGIYECETKVLVFITNIIIKGVVSLEEGYKILGQDLSLFSARMVLEFVCFLEGR